MSEVIYLFIAGGLGALSRHGVSTLAHRWFGLDFPYGTLAVNIIGSLLIGFIMQLGIAGVIPRELRVIVTVGFLGAFTTFSAFSYDTIGFIRDGAWLTAGTNILLNVIVCVLAALGGIWLARLAFGTG